MNRDTLLIVGAGLETIPGILQAKHMGLHVVVSDMDPYAPGFKHADEFIVASTYDVATTLEAAVNYHKTTRPINGVMCVASDIPHTVAAIADHLGLHGIPVEAANMAMDKLVMKDMYAAAGVPIPWYRPVGKISELKQIIRDKGYPLVLKPTDSRGARGVLLLTETLDLEWAYEYSLSYSQSNRIMAERFLAGPQISTESLIIDGEIYTLGLSDRNYENLPETLPHIVEDGGDLPSQHAQGYEQEIDELLLSAAKVMEVGNGVIKGDIVISGGKPHIIELAPRLSGGYFCSHQIPLSTGVNFVEKAIKLALGYPVDSAELKTRSNNAISQRYIFPSPGKVEKITGVKQAQHRQGIELCEIRLSPGDQISEVHNHPERGGVVIASGSSREEACARATRAIQDIHIKTVI